MSLQSSSVKIPIHDVDDDVTLNGTPENVARDSGPSSSSLEHDRRGTTPSDSAGVQSDPLKVHRVHLAPMSGEGYVMAIARPSSSASTMTDRLTLFSCLPPSQVCVSRAGFIGCFNT